MKINEKKQLASKTKEELLLELREVSVNLAKAKMDHAQHKLKNSRLISNLRDKIARIKTVMRLKEKEESNG